MRKESMHSIVYQIWPRSFQDSNNDGIGDINGIRSRLDYLVSLGIDMIWLSPVYQSPEADFGYDISDYYNINPIFGTMLDFDQLIKEAKDKNISIMMDLVANHTSDQHDWYKQALKDKNSPYRDYYIFKEGKNGKEPNNWIGLFGGSAWTKVEENTYVLTLFTPKQVDLNWRNPAVRKEIHDIMHFWLKKGIKGFRMDVINAISKHPDLPDKHPRKKGYQFADELIVSRPEVDDYLKEMYDEVLCKYDAIYLGEGLLLNREAAARYCGEQSRELDLMFQFDLALIDCGPLGKFDFRKFYRWTIPQFKKLFFAWQTDAQAKNYWIANYLSNHDQPRAVSHYGNDGKFREESAKALLMSVLFARGTPFIYQGEEIGMTDLKLEMDEWRDFEAINVYTQLQSMMHLPKYLAKKVIQHKTRDNARTPVQWTKGEYAGFSTVQPWIKLNPNHKKINVLDQENDADSVLNFTRQAIKLWKTEEIFTFGTIQPILTDHPQILGFIRSDGQKSYVVLINLDDKPATMNLQEDWCGETLLNSVENRQILITKMVFKPYEARVARVINHIV
jgi:oligo-1,6-glucosidase